MKRFLPVIITLLVCLLITQGFAVNIDGEQDTTSIVTDTIHLSVDPVDSIGKVLPQQNASVTSPTNSRELVPKYTS